jgi:hypothetical protein
MWALNCAGAGGSQIFEVFIFEEESPHTDLTGDWLQNPLNESPVSYHKTANSLCSI